MSGDSPLLGASEGVYYNVLVYQGKAAFAIHQFELIKEEWGWRDVSKEITNKAANMNAFSWNARTLSRASYQTHTTQEMMR